MGKIAFVFPGQGSQTVGMGKDVFDQFEASRTCFETADRVLGFELSSLIFNGPENELTLTANTQPALLTTSVAILEAFLETGIQADYVAGHSLGEYSALVASGVLSFEDAVRIVRKRGEFMEKAVPAGQGAMAAALGAKRDDLVGLCAKAMDQGHILELANINCPGQIVLSGTKEGIQFAVEHGKEAGAKRVIPLDVSGPFHSSLMKPAAEQLALALENVHFSDASVPVVVNVDARPEQNGDTLRERLIEQVYSSVLWEDSVKWLLEQGVDTFYEIGSGTVLAGLIKKIDRSVNVTSIHSVEALEKLKKELSPQG